MKLVSIGLPVHNGENYIGKALESIIAQTYGEWELIICDNASDDATKEICEVYASADSRIRYYRNAGNIGAIANYNRVLELSRGEYFRWHAHDDLIAPTFIERSVQVLEAYPSLSVCFSGVRYIDGDGAVIRESGGSLTIDDPDVSRRLESFVYLQRESSDIYWAIFGLVRAAVLKKTGGFRKFVASDQALLLRLLMEGGFREIPDALFSRRIHEYASTVRLPKSPYRERARWYSMGTSLPLVLPNWNLFAEDLSAVLKTDRSIKDKLACSSSILRMFGFRWKRMLKEIVSIPRQLALG